MLLGNSNCHFAWLMWYCFSTLCPIGRAQQYTGRSSCDLCQGNTYQNYFGGVQCEACLDTQYVLRTPSADHNIVQSKCVDCPAGAICNNGALFARDSFYLSPLGAGGTVVSLICLPGDCQVLFAGVALYSRHVNTTQACPLAPPVFTNSSSDLLTLQLNNCCGFNRMNGSANPLCGGCKVCRCFTL